MATRSTLLLGVTLLAASLGFPPAGAAQAADLLPPLVEPVVSLSGTVMVSEGAIPTVWRLAERSAVNLTAITLTPDLLGEPSMNADGVQVWTFTVGSLVAAPNAKRNEDNRPAPPAPPPAPPSPPQDGLQRPLGAFRVLRSVLEVLLAMLKGLAFLLPLYHRIAPERALDHPLRARLLVEVARRPGLHVAALAEALDAHPKTLAHHLRVLARGRLVRLEREGRIVRAFPPAVLPGGDAPEASATRARALDILRAGPPLARDELAGLLGVTPQAVSYHLKILHGQGKVRVRWLGRRRRYEVG